MAIPSPVFSAVSGGIPTADKFGSSATATTIHASAAETLAFNSGDLDCASWRRGMIVCDLTAIAGTSPTVTFVLEEKDSVSGKYIQMGSSAAEGAAKTVTFIVDESARTLTAAAGQEFVLIGPFHGTIYRVRTVFGGTVTSHTFSIGAIARPQ